MAEISDFVCNFQHLIEENVECSGVIVPVDTCTKDTFRHLRNLHVSVPNYASKPLSEGDLILNRGGFYGTESYLRKSMGVCQSHRNFLGIYWNSKRRTCAHPLHKGNAKPTRKLNLEMSEEVFIMFQQKVAIGSGICPLCRKKHGYSIKAAQENSQNKVLSKERKETLKAKLDNETIDEQQDYDDVCQTASQLSDDAPNTSTSLFEERLVGDIVYNEDFYQNSDGQNPEDINAEYMYIQSGSQTTDTTFTQCSSHEEWIPEMSSLERLNTAIKLISDGRIAPIRSQLSIPWKSASYSTKNYYRKATRDIIGAIMNIMIPYENEDTYEEIFQKETEKEIADNSIQVMAEIHKEASSQVLKSEVLSVFVNKYSKSEIMKILPEVTKYQIDSARKLSKQADKNNSSERNDKFNSRLPFEKVQHFVSFISQPQFLQDVAFGERKMKLSTGQNIYIPNVVRTLIGSRIISAYIAYCKEENFQPCGRSSLYSILSDCAASQRKSMAGLDNTTADGMSAFDRLHQIINKLKDCDSGTNIDFKDIEKRLRASKRYLTSEYRWHVGISTVPDHCIPFSLSDTSKNPSLYQQCDHAHEDGCIQCINFNAAVDDLEQKIVDTTFTSNEIKDEIVHDFQNCTYKIFQWKQHILRTVNQDKGKQDIIKSLSANQYLIIMDWAMKFLPWFDREKQTDFYGKKGINWHVSVAISKDSEQNIKTLCFVHLFDSVAQDWFAVASIVESLLTFMKQQNPELESVYLRSDNAGCYHCSSLLAAIPEISIRTRVKVNRYDFSEAQSGKDICDRRTAPMKIHAKRFGNEGHDITTAEDLKLALESYGGTDNTYVFLCELDISKKVQQKGTIFDSITLYNNFCYEERGLRMWRGYSVGEGQLVTYREIEKKITTKQNETGLMIMKYPIYGINIPTAGMRNRQRKGRKRKHKEAEQILEVSPDCMDTSNILASDTTELQQQEEQSSESATSDFGYHCKECGAVFAALKDFNTHLDIGNHDMNKDDKIKLLWNKECVNAKEEITTTLTCHQVSTTEINLLYGWALKTKRQSQRFSIAVKTFIKDLFQEGEITGKKYTPTAASKKIRNARNVDGEKLKYLRKYYLDKIIKVLDDN